MVWIPSVDRITVVAITKVVRKWSLRLFERTRDNEAKRNGQPLQLPRFRFSTCPQAL